MEMTGIPFGTTDWQSLEPSHHRGEQGDASWRTRQFGSIRVRMVDYSPGISYRVADGAEPHRSSSPGGARLFIVD